MEATYIIKFNDKERLIILSEDQKSFEWFNALVKKPIYLKNIVIDYKITEIDKHEKKTNK